MGRSVPSPFQPMPELAPVLSPLDVDLLALMGGAGGGPAGSPPVF
ncbi:hypothetical protein [Saccharopolyspora rosea]|uniref:Uncharacterized protein n=1 Tax=Saccharopolyspora rosea TaxID=524884 RepID=A0ABW3FUR4_9PSEU|nr:hypothetical protein [Saccharopolyspora rosea]